MNRTIRRRRALAITGIFSAGALALAARVSENTPVSRP
jgi:hypothetical protein